MAEHDRHFRFELPDPVFQRGVAVTSDGFWMSHETPYESVMLVVEGVGSFIRSLVPVHLTGGYAVTLGVWVGVPHEDLLWAFEHWFAPEYIGLSIDGVLANKIPPLGGLGAAVRLGVLDADHSPYCVSSTDKAVSGILAEVWPHDLVLSALPRQ